MTASPIRVGTRASLLARTQAAAVADALAHGLSADVELVEVTTEGDVSGAPLVSFGGAGVFVSALRDALLERRVDVAVHSLKDLPTQPAEGIALAAVPRREDPRDVLVARERRTLAELAPGALVGTGSPRRAAQIRALGLGLEVVGVRGNVDTRLAKVGADVDAVVLARAGLARIGRLDAVTEVLDPLQMLPAPGQGALAVEVRASDPTLGEHVAAVLDDRDTRAAVTAERRVLAELEAGCSAPVGALAEVVDGDDGEELWVRAIALSLDGSVAVRRSSSGPVVDPDGVGARLAAEMLDDGAMTVLAEPVR